jgi:DNA primase
MSIPSSFIDQLIDQADIVEVVGRRLQLNKKGSNFWCLCPFHDDSNPSMAVNQDKQFFYCFVCQESGNAIHFLRQYENLDFVDAIETLASSLGLTVPYENGKQDKIKPSGLVEQAVRFYQKNLNNQIAEKAIQYLKDRSISGETAKKFNIGFAEDKWDALSNHLGKDIPINELEASGLFSHKDNKFYDRFRGRIIFPIRNIKGEFIAMGGRIIDEGEPKYLNSPETAFFNKSNELFGLFEVKEAEKKIASLIVVEGYMDVIALAQYGISNAIATLGTATSIKHLNRLFRNVPEIIFCFDGDEAGKKAAWRALEIALPLLQEGRQIRFIFLPQGNDPDNLVRREGAQGFNNHLARATPLSKFLFNTLTQQVDMANLDGRARLVELAKPLLKPLPIGPYRDLMLQKLSELSGVNLNHLTKLIQGEIPKQPTVKRTIRKTIESTRELSLVDQAIIYLLHKPALSLQIEQHYHEQLSKLNKPNIKLLLKIIELTKENPHLKLGALCEHWRKTEYEQTINYLATPDFIEKQINIDDEFFGAINLLYKDYVVQRNAFLMQKSPNLTAAEKQELQSLYKYHGAKQ